MTRKWYQQNQSWPSLDTESPIADGESRIKDNLLADRQTRHFISLRSYTYEEKHIYKIIS